VAGSNNYEKYTSAMVGGTPPDAVLTSGYPVTVQWAASDLIQPMDQWSKQLGIKKEDYFPWIWAMQYHHGKLWALVQEYDTNIFVWNKSLLESSGLDPNKPPTQITALDDAAQRMLRVEADKTISQAGFVPWLSNGNPTVLWIAAHGADVMDDKQEKWTLNTPTAQRVLTWYQQYVRRFGTNDAANQFTSQFSGKTTPLGSGKVGMQVVGDWIPLLEYDKNTPSLKYGVGKIPSAQGVPEGTNTVIGSDTFVLPAKVKHPEESMRFLLYMDSPEPVLAWCLGEANVPPTPKMANDPKFLNGSSYNKVLVDMAKPGLLHPYPVSPIYNDVVGYLNAAVTKARNGEPVVDSLAEAQRQADQKAAEFKAQKPGW
jgi:ABC-type glycerol-3-phosphate transport system substrate-binding protein